MNSHGVPCEALQEGLGAFGYGVLQEKGRVLLVNSHGAPCGALREGTLLVNSRLVKRVGAPPFGRAPSINTG